MVDATGGRAVNSLTTMEGGGPIVEVAVMTGMSMQEEVGGMTIAEMTEMTTAEMTEMTTDDEMTVMIIAGMTIEEEVETVTDAATENEVEAVMGQGIEVVV